MIFHQNELFIRVLAPVCLWCLRHLSTILLSMLGLRSREMKNVPSYFPSNINNQKPNRQMRRRYYFPQGLQSNGDTESPKQRSRPRSFKRAMTVGTLVAMFWFIFQCASSMHLPQAWARSLFSHSSGTVQTSPAPSESHSATKSRPDAGNVRI